MGTFLYFTYGDYIDVAQTSRPGLEKKGRREPFFCVSSHLPFNILSPEASCPAGSTKDRGLEH